LKVSLGVLPDRVHASIRFPMHSSITPHGTPTINKVKQLIQPLPSTLTDQIQQTVMKTKSQLYLCVITVHDQHNASQT
jgi:hypothetical protein